MTTTKTPEQSERVQLDILNQLTDTQARLADAERAKGRPTVADIEEAWDEWMHFNWSDFHDMELVKAAFEAGAATAIRTPDPVSHASEEER